MSNPKIARAMSRIAQGDVPWGSLFTDKMLTMEWREGDGWSPPSIRPYGPLPLPPSASVFHYGMEIFEGLKAYKSGPVSDPQVRLFRPQLNIARLNHSAKRLALPGVDPEAFLDILSAFVDAQSEWVPAVHGASLYLRPCIVATENRIGVRRSNSALLFVIASPVGSFFSTGDSVQTQYLKGIKLLADPKYIRAWKGGVGSCKTGGNYAMSIAPAEEAREQGYDQILWLSDAENPRVTEAGMMNVFFTERDPETGGKSLITPRLDGTILDGVTRRSVLELAKDFGIPAEERDISLVEVCKKVDEGRIVEIFGSGTAAVVSPVHSITTNSRVVAVKQKEASGDLSVLFRERLAEIHNSAQSHPWMVPVSGRGGTQGATTDSLLRPAEGFTFDQDDK